MTSLRKQETASVSLTMLFALSLVSGLSVTVVPGAATAKPLAVASGSSPAQTPSAIVFPLTTNVPVGTTIRIGGSSSMETINQALKQRFEQQFVGTKVELRAQGTGPAIKDLMDGNTDLAAIGRTLLEQEKAQGLVSVPISRHKIAIIVGSENPFKGGLTFEQFAKIFRGEIKDWAQVGGEPGPIRFIDRPDNSDTRQAFRNYPVFKQAPFVTGKTARPIAQDSTSQVVEALRTDGISYAIADQLQGRGDVRVIPMHQVLPSNPKYPFSQPLVYVYKGPQPNFAVQAFLGYATAPVSRKTIETARKEATAALANAPIASPSPKLTIPVPQSVAPSAIVAAQTPSPSPTADLDPTHQAMPWLWLAPLAGGLLWWLLKRNAETEDMEPELETGIDGSIPSPVGNFMATEGPLATPEPLLMLEPVPADCMVAPQLEAMQPAIASGTAALMDDRASAMNRAVLADSGATPTVIAADCDRPHNTDADRLTLAPCNGTAVQPDGMALTSSVARGGLVAAAAPGSGAAANGLVVDHSLSRVSETPDAGFAAHPFLNGPVADSRLLANQSQIMLIPRTPRELYVSWDVKQAEKDVLKQQGGQHLVLRVYAATGADAPLGHNVQQCFCNDWEHEQHVPIAVSNLDYVAELGYTTLDGRFLMLARSPQTRVPGA